MKKIYKVLRGGKVIESRKPGKYAGWRSEKIFGRLDCKSGMRMKKENRVFFLTWKDAVAEGYRPCKKCRPTPNDTYPKEHKTDTFYRDLADTVCPKYKKDFILFVDEATSSNEYWLHFHNCERCHNALEKAFKHRPK